MLKLNSRTGIAKADQKTVYTYLCDFRNFAHLLPEDKLKDVEITERTVQFSIEGLGKIGLQLAGQEPFHELTIKAMEGASVDFTFLINIREMSAVNSEVTITLEANLNMFIEMMAKSPLQQFLELMISRLEAMEFKNQI